jgi:hypothetical protein
MMGHLTIENAPPGTGRHTAIIAVVDVGQFAFSLYMWGQRVLGSHRTKMTGQTQSEAGHDELNPVEDAWDPHRRSSP